MQMQLRTEKANTVILSFFLICGVFGCLAGFVGLGVGLLLLGVSQAIGLGMLSGGVGATLVGTLAGKILLRQIVKEVTGQRYYSLVMLRNTMDDIPLRLFMDHAAAVAFAQTVSPDVPANVRALWNTDASTPIGVDVVTFRDGDLASVERVRSFTEDE